MRVKWFELKEFMSVVGEVIFVDIYRRKFGEGVVEFVNKEDMINVLEIFDKYEFFGKKIKLIEEIFCFIRD